MTVRVQRTHRTFVVVLLAALVAPAVAQGPSNPAAAGRDDLYGHGRIDAANTQLPVMLTVSVTGSGRVVSDPAGISAPADSTEAYDVGTSVRLAALPDSGWQFGAWGGGGAACGTDSLCTVTMDAAKTVTATFAEITKRLIVLVREGGSVTSEPPGIAAPSDSVEQYVLGTTVTLRAASDSGWGFDRWDGDARGCASDASCTLVMDQDRAVEAVFVRQFTLTVAVAGPGSVTSTPPGIAAPEDSTATFRAGELIRLAAAPDTGAVFLRWTADDPAGFLCDTAGRCDLAMDRTWRVTARFVQQHQLTVSVTGAGAVESDPPGINAPRDSAERFIQGTSVTLRATAVTGWLLDTWGADADSCAADTNCTLVMARPQHATARFGTPLLWTDTVPATAVMGAPFADTLQASGGVGSFRWWVVSGTLPPGLSLDANGVAAGIPELPGTFTPRLAVASGRQTAERTVLFAVEAPALVLDSVVQAVLADSTILTADERRYLDLLGNKNGGLDVGDFLGWIRATRQQVSPALLESMLRNRR